MLYIRSFISEKNLKLSYQFKEVYVATILIFKFKVLQMLHCSTDYCNKKKPLIFLFKTHFETPLIILSTDFFWSMEQIFLHT